MSELSELSELSMLPVKWYHRRRFILLITLLCLGLLIAGMFAGMGGHNYDAPLAQNGILDLRNWDFEEGGRVPLHGEWEFYWEEFVQPSAFSAGIEGERSGLITIPGYWNKYQLGEELLPGQGYGTFHLTVLLPDDSPSLAIKVREILTSFVLYSDGLPVISVGQIGTNREEAVPLYNSQIASLSFNDDSQIEFTLHISNFHHRKGGLWEGLWIGVENKVISSHVKATGFEIFLMGCVIVMGLYHLALFLFRREDLVALNFGLFCIIVALRTMTTGELFGYVLMPDLPWSILHRVEYISFYLAAFFFMTYFHAMFPQSVHIIFLRIVQIVSISYSLFVIVTPPWIYTYSVQSFQIFTAFLGVYIIVKLSMGCNRGLRDAVLMLAGFVVLFALIINDVLHTNALIHTGFYLPTGMMVFLFFQALIIAQKFTVSFKLSGFQAEKLRLINVSLNDEVANRRALERELVKSHAQFAQSRIGIILGLARLAEYRDEDTGAHLERIREYSRAIAVEAAKLQQYRGYITAEYVEDLYQSSILHDIGKVGISDAILLKPARLTAEEFGHIKKHPGIGGDAIANVEEKINVKSFLTLARDIAYNHHEKWDGSGYPQGKVGENIPLSARIVAIADVYDALTSERPYKDAYTHEKAFNIIVEGRGSHFDPQLVDIFVGLEEEIIRINTDFQD